MKHGVEQEIQVVNEEGLLVYKVKEILEKIPKEYISYKNCGGIYQDVYDSQLEIGTSACQTLEDLQNELLELRGLIAEKAEKSGLYLIATGGNPFLLPNVGELFAEQHHLDAATNEEKLRLNNFLRIFSPELFAISVNSPITQGRIARWKSFRASTKSMDVVNRVNPNIKPTLYLGMEDIERGYLLGFEYEKSYDEKRKKSRYYDFSPLTKKDRYTDIYKPTIEVRLFDAQQSVPITLGYAAILQALVEKSKLFSKIPNIEITYNRDAAIEKGLQARFVVEQIREYRNLLHYDESRTHAYEIVHDFLEWLKPEIKELGYEKFVEPIKRMVLERRDSADWQLHMYTKKRNDYIPSLIEKTMKSFDKEVFDRKVEIRLVSEIEEKEDPVIKKGIDNVIYAMEHLPDIDVRTTANTIITIIEVAPDNRKKIDGYIKKLKESALVDGSLNSDPYLTACFVEMMLAAGETLDKRFENAVNWLLNYAKKNTQWSSQIWLNSYILGVLKRVGVSENILKVQLEWVKNKLESEVEFWVLAYMVDTLTIFGINMEQTVKKILSRIDKDHWHIVGIEDTTITALIYRSLRTIGYRNQDIVEYLKTQLKTQEKILNSKSLYNISLILRSLSQEVVK